MMNIIFDLWIISAIFAVACIFISPYFFLQHPGTPVWDAADKPGGELHPHLAGAGEQNIRAHTLMFTLGTYSPGKN